MDQLQNPSNRKKFLLWGAALVSAITFSKYFKGTQKNIAIGCGSKPSIKMLTQDGSLVEIDKNMVISPGKKISNRELQQWIKKESINTKPANNEL
ncbi:MAG: hypothetical protein HOP10_03715 [Chitinophagaceae bacterium]|nr:hypothetical protein [Chitinophagaceae bacterium]